MQLLVRLSELAWLEIERLPIYRRSSSVELSSPSDDTIKITHRFASYADGRVTAQGASPVLICHLDFGVDNSRLQTLTIKFIGTSLECVSWEISLSLWTSGSLVQLSWSLNGRLAHPFFVVQPLSARRPPKFEFSDGILSQSDCALYLRKLFGIVESIVCVCANNPFDLERSASSPSGPPRRFRISEILRQFFGTPKSGRLNLPLESAAWIVCLDLLQMKKSRPESLCIISLEKNY